MRQFIRFSRLSLLFADAHADGGGLDTCTDASFAALTIAKLRRDGSVMHLRSVAVLFIFRNMAACTNSLTTPPSLQPLQLMASDEVFAVRGPLGYKDRTRFLSRIFPALPVAFLKKYRGSIRL